MIIKVYFEKTNKPIPFSNQKQLNGFNHNVLGQNNKYHDKFSNYSISNIRGGKPNAKKEGLMFEKEPYIQVSSKDTEFINKYLEGLIAVQNTDKANFFGLKATRFESYDHKPSKNGFDVIKTNSPIIIKDEDGKTKLTCNDANWLKRLIENSKAKLKHEGIEDDTFNIVAKNKDNLKSRMLMVGDVFNPCTSAVLTVYGKESTRYALYNMGLGNSTGSGFGSVSILQSK